MSDVTQVDLPLPRGQLPDLVKTLVRLVEIDDSSIVERFLLEMLAILVNKFVDIPDLSIVFEMVCNSSSGLFVTATSAKRVRAGLSVCRALALRPFRSDIVLSTMIGLLSSEAWSLEAVKGFETLLSPCDMLLHEHRGTIKPLVKQRIFDHCLPILSEQIRIASTSLKTSHLRALCGLLATTHTSIITLHAAFLIPLLLLILDLEEARSRSVAIGVLSRVMASNQPIIEQHISSLVSRLMVASSCSKEPSWVSSTSIWQFLERALELTVTTDDAI